MSFETRFFYDVKLIVWGWRIGWRSGEAKKRVRRRKKFPNQPYAVRIDLRQDEEIYALNSFCEKESLRGFSKSMIFFYTHRSNRHPHYFDYALFNASSPVVRWCASAEVLGQMFLLFLLLCCKAISMLRPDSAPHKFELSGEFDQSKCTLIRIIEDGHQKGWEKWKTKMFQFFCLFRESKLYLAMWILRKDEHSLVLCILWRKGEPVFTII